MRTELQATIVFIGLSSCASVFPYKWYGIDVETQRLLAKEPKDDLPLTVCRQDDVSKGKCVVMFTEEFDRLASDYAEKTERLKRCRE